MIDDGRLERAMQEAKALGIKETVARETSNRPPHGTPEYRHWWRHQNAFSPSWLAFKQRSDERAWKRRTA